MNPASKVLLAVSKRGPFLLLLVACGLALLHAWHFRYLADDAFISFHYARNLARGLGLSWHAGEHTMGYSDLSWVLILALFDRIGVDPPNAAQFLGATFACATLFLVQRHLERQHRSLLPAAAALGLLVANGTFALWIFGGLEGHLFGFLLVYVVVTTLGLAPDAGWRKALPIGVGLGLACLTRPEGLLFAAPVCAFLFLRGGKDRWPIIGVVAAIALATTGALIAWQWSSYGAPFPNTYYAKTLPITWPLLRRGLYLTRDFVALYNGLPVFVVVGWLWFAAKTRDARGWLPLFVIGAFFVFYLRIGGDALVLHRMWVPVLPMFALLAGDLVADLGESRARSGARVGPLAAVAIVLIGLPASFGPALDYVREDEQNLRTLRFVSRKLHGLPENTVIAANVVGIPAYYSERAVIDMLGLNDARIARSPKEVGIPAHESHDGASVLARMPDVILPAFPGVYPSPPPIDALQPYPSDRDLFADARMKTEYVQHNVPLRGGYFVFFIRRGYGATEYLLSQFRE